MMFSGGYRVDGRRLHELRNIAISYKNVDNRVHLEFEQGCTKVAVSLDGIKPASKQKGRVNVTLTFLDVSREEKSKNTDKGRDMERSIGEVFSRVVLLPQGSSLDIDVVVKQEDGSLFVAAVNCISMGLCYLGVPMKDTVVAVTVGFVEENFLVDTCGAEENYEHPHMSVVLMSYRRKLAYMHMVGRIEREGFEEMFRHGYEASTRLFSEFETRLKGFSVGGRE